MTLKDQKEACDKKIRDHNPDLSLAEIREILVKKGLLDKDEELAEGMLEDLVHYAYFTCCINKLEVRRLLGLSKKESKELIKAWKRNQEGNRSCHLQHNPFYEEWPAEGKNLPPVRPSDFK